MSPALEEKTLHVLISKNAPEAEAKMKASNDGLKVLKEYGRRDALMSGFCDRPGSKSCVFFSDFSNFFNPYLNNCDY